MKSVDFCYKIKNETTDDDAPIDLVSVPRKRVYGGGQKMLSAQSIWIQKIQMMPTRFLKVKMMEVLRKTLPKYRFCVHRISTTARLLFTN